MAEITASLVPGQYTTGQTLTVKFPPGVDKAVVTYTSLTPALSEVLAYDRGVIPPGTTIVDRPFISVTQDGKGNVVYDGGFPKFYNWSLKVNDIWPTTLPNTWDKLTPSSKYMFNAFNWCANKRKTDAGNRKVLLISDGGVGTNYSLRESHYDPLPGIDPESAIAGTGFRDTFNAICAAGGWTPTYRDKTFMTGGANLNISYSELDEYVLVVLLSTANGYLDERLSKNIAIFREAGNGVIIITDHSGLNYTSVADALANPNGFTVAANQVAANFGCYFSGAVDREPVLVSEIKAQIGAPGPPRSHPLLANIPDNDYIFAGGSESITYPELYLGNLVDPTKDLVVPMLTPGTYYVNVVARMDDTTILTKYMKFIIIDPSDFNLLTSLNVKLGSTLTTYKRGWSYSISSTNNPTGVYRGELRVNDIVNGFFRLESGVLYYFPLAGDGSPIPVSSGNVLSFYLTSPFQYNIPFTITIPDTTTQFNASMQVASFITALRGFSEYAGKADEAMIGDVVATADSFYNEAADRGKSGIVGEWFKRIGLGRKAFTTTRMASCKTYIRQTEAAWNTSKPVTEAIGSCCVIVATGRVYYFCESCLMWLTHPQTAAQLFGLNRIIDDIESNVNYRIDANALVAI